MFFSTCVWPLEVYASHLGSTCKPHTTALDLDLWGRGERGNESQRDELRSLETSPSSRAEGIESSSRMTLLRPPPPPATHTPESPRGSGGPGKPSVWSVRSVGHTGDSCGAEQAPVWAALWALPAGPTSTSWRLKTIISDVTRDSAAWPCGWASAGCCFQYQLGSPMTQRPAAQRVRKGFLMTQLERLWLAARATSASGCASGGTGGELRSSDT